jgi:plasmid replication initiation protein
MKTLKRIWNFDKDDMYHMKWLFKNLFKQFFIGIFEGNMHEFTETLWWIKIHCIHDSKRIK